MSDAICQDCGKEFSGKVIRNEMATEPIDPSTLCQECHDRAYGTDREFEVDPVNTPLE